MFPTRLAEQILAMYPGAGHSAFSGDDDSATCP